MTEPLTIDRFRDLADAYGGLTDRWPERYRQEAAAMARHPEAAAILAEASLLDRELDAWRVPAPRRELAERVAANGPVVVRRLLTKARLWWSGVGFAAALAGAAAGAATVVIATPDDLALGASTSFGHVTAAEE